MDTLFMKKGRYHPDTSPTGKIKQIQTILCFNLNITKIISLQ